MTGIRHLLGTLAIATAVLAHPVAAQTDYDTDDDNLIEITKLEQLNMLRHDLDGDSSVAADVLDDYQAAFVDSISDMGCPDTCMGYELRADLDFNNDNDYRDTDNKSAWTTGAGWMPIGDLDSPYAAVLNGNGHTVRNLHIARDRSDQGLFGVISGATIRNIGVTGTVGALDSNRIGGLVGYGSDSVIADSYSAVAVEGGQHVGSLAGLTAAGSAIRRSYATGNVYANFESGGLLGADDHRATPGIVEYAYAAGYVDLTRGGDMARGGGLIGNLGDVRVLYSYSVALLNPGASVSGGIGGIADDISCLSFSSSILSSCIDPTDDGDRLADIAIAIAVYSDSETSGKINALGTFVPSLAGITGRTTAQLQNPTAYAGIYANWDDDGNDYWDFGSAEQYPALKIDFDNDDTATWQEFGYQLREGPRFFRKRGSGASRTLSWSAPITSHWSNPPPVTYALYRDGVALNVGANAITERVGADGVTVYSHTDSGLRADAVYDYNIAAVINGGEASRNITERVGGAADYDRDDDGLIEITTLEQLAAIRYDLNGDGAVARGAWPDYAAAFVDAMVGMGCPGDCIGYELQNDLDFDNDDDYRDLANKSAWTAGAGWAPLGSADEPFAATFDGGGHTIRSLFIARSAQRQGLFGYAVNATIRNVGVTGSVDADDHLYVGGLVAQSDAGTIEGSYSAAEVEGRAYVGSLVGFASAGSAIVRSYATGNAYADTEAGGLLGRDNHHRARGTVTHSYATGYVDVTRGGSLASSGGLIGNLGDAAVRYGYATGLVRPGDASGGFGGMRDDAAEAVAVYWDRETSGRSNALGRGDLAGVEGKTAAELQAPTTYTGIYAGWNSDGSDYWDFGSAEQYPALKIDFDGDGTASWQEFGYQLREGPRDATAIRVDHANVLVWNAPDTSHWPSLSAVAYAVYRDGAVISEAENILATTYVDTARTDGVTHAYVVAALVNGGEAARSVAARPRAEDIDYDRDDDGLIEINTLEQLNAIRWDPDGDGKPANASSRTYAEAFPGITDNTGCPDTCGGYELINDLDFADPRSYAVADPLDYDWIDNPDDGNAEEGWPPISGFAATFNGNGHAVYNLYVSRNANDQGLFGSVSGTITNIGITGLIVSPVFFAGGLAGQLNNGGMIEKSYSAVAVEDGIWSGSLAGMMNGGAAVRLSYASGVVNASANAGGLLGVTLDALIPNTTTETLEHVYATGFVDASDAGNAGGLTATVGALRLKYIYATALVSGSGEGSSGLGGYDEAGFAATAVYWDTETSNQSVGVATRSGMPVTGVEGKTTAELQAPTTYTGIYANWDEGDTADYWDFGTAEQYPALKIDFDNDGTASWQEFGYQLREGPRGAAISAANALIWSAPDTSHWDNPPPISYRVYRDGLALSADSAYSYLDASASTGTEHIYHIAAVVGGGEAARTAFAHAYARVGRDYDTDDDGLIEIATLEQLNAIRWDLDGDGAPANASSPTYAEAFPDAVIGMGCPDDVCAGYELIKDLDFGDAADYASGTANTDWTSGEGWMPLGGIAEGFAAVFNGNGHTVRNLHIRRSAFYQGLFGIVGEDVLITNVGVTGSVDSSYDTHPLGAPIYNWHTGGLVGNVNNSAIENSYSAVAVAGGARAGSLLGYATDASAVRRSYATGAVYADSESGGLLGRDFDSQAHGTVEHAYATGYVNVTRGSLASNGGGLIGVLGNVALRYGYATGLIHPDSQSSGGLGGSVEASAVAAAVYWDSETSAKTNAFGEGALAGVSGKTAAELQAPTSYAGIYADWNAADADGNATDYWDFGNASQYPALKIDFDNDGTASWQEFGYQLREGPRLREGLQRVTRDGIAFDLRWSAPDTSHWDNPPQIDYRIYRDGAALDIGADDIAETRDANGEIVYSYADTGLFNGTAYAYHIAAVVNGGEASRSATAVEVDYDSDDDGLIEITTLEQLNAVRWDLNGDGTPATENAGEYAQAFPGIAGNTGCPAACVGYELRRDLDFEDPQSYAAADPSAYGWVDDPNDSDTEEGWAPIAPVSMGNDFVSFTATFNGNGHTIYNLYLSNANNQGLFGYVSGAVSNIGVTGSALGSPSGFVGGTDGQNIIRALRFLRGVGGFVGGVAAQLVEGGVIEKSYSAMSADGSSGVGSLLGFLDSGTVRLSYATGAVGASAVGGGGGNGGLIGMQSGVAGNELEHVYATGFVDTATADDFFAGGLIGITGALQPRYAYATALVGGAGTVGAIAASAPDDFAGTAVYWDAETADRSIVFDSGASTATGIASKTSAELQAPTGYDGIYANWNSDGSDYWDFGNAEQYPALKIDFDNDGMARWQEFGYQLREGPRNLTVSDVSEGFRTLRWSAPDTSHWPHNPPAVTYAVYHDGAELSGDITETTDANGDVVYSYVDSDAFANLGYGYHVAAVVGGGEPSRSAMAWRIDYDRDDDGLIDITTLEELNAIRWDLDGDAAPVANADAHLYAAVFPGISGRSCPGRACGGYELLNDLDFGDAADYASGEVRAEWTSGIGWLSIGGAADSFATTFNGNGHTIANLHIDDSTRSQGLFGYVSGTVSNLGVTGAVSVFAGGGIAGQLSGGAIERSYSAVSASGNRAIGSLLGLLAPGTARLSYATGVVGASAGSGGLLGAIRDLPVGNEAEHVYATGFIDTADGDNVGGGLIGFLGPLRLQYAYATALVGGSGGQSGGLGGGEDDDFSATAVYWDTEASGLAVATPSATMTGAEGRTAAELQAPTTYAGIYADWDEGGAADYWDFGSASQYPALKIDFDNDGTASWEEFGYQLREGPRLREGLQRVTQDKIDFDLRWSAPDTSHWDSPPQISYRIYRDGSALEIGADDIGETLDANGDTVYSYADAGLSGDTVHIYHIAAVVGGGEPSRSAIVFEADYDRDDDGLIEINTLEQLNAIRWDPDGDGKPANASSRTYAEAFPGITDNTGCPDTCGGYELINDLDFEDPRSYAVADPLDYDWIDNPDDGNAEEGWPPISGFTATFNGNGHAVYNLYVSRNANDQGLFGSVSGTITNIGITGLIVSPVFFAGGLAGQLNNGGMIEKSYSAVAVEDGIWSGSLAGMMNGGAAVRLSYASGVVNASANAGGLLGVTLDALIPNTTTETLEHVYATGFVDASDAGNAGGLTATVGALRLKYIYATALVSGSGEGSSGLGGYDEAGFAATAVYWDTETSNQSVGVATRSGMPVTGVEGKTTAELQAPTTYTGIYANWDEGDTADYWDFGTAEQYPALKIDFDNNDMARWQEFGYQLREGPQNVEISAASATGITLSWTAPDTSHWDNPPSVTYALYRDGAPLSLAADAIAETADANGDVVYSYADLGASADTAYRYHIAATVNGGEPSRSYVFAGRLGVTDRDAALNTIAESGTTGTAVSGLRLSVTEMGAAPFGDVIWGLDDPTDTFGISAASAEIGLLASDTLDYASTRTYSVAVTATLDGTELPPLPLTINVLNDIENVRVQDDDPSPNRVLENTPIDTPISGLSPAAYEMPASGGSVELEQATWSLADNADFDPYTGGIFAIDAAAGTLTLVAAADYETSSQHSVWAVAAVTHPITGDVLRGGERFEVRVVNIPETLTIMDGDPAANTIAENATTGTAVTGIILSASEGNLPLTGGEDFRWELTDTAADLFAIDPVSGEITLVASGMLNYEDIGARTHSVTVRAVAGTVVSDDLELTISVLNVPDTLTIIDSDMNANTIAENATTGTEVAGIDLTATDEGGNTVSSATWSLTDSNEPALFAIATDTGAITLIASDRLDHETAPTHSVIVTAAAAGYQSATATLTINVTNALEKLTIANSGNGVIEIAEGAPTGTAVPGINLVATDENDEPVTDLIWRLTDSAGDLFAIASDTGVISVNRALIFEMSTSHSITAQASSQTVVSDALTLEINVLSAEACAALTPAQFFNGTACVDFAVCVEPATLDETENTCTVPKLRIVADTATIAENATTGTEVAGIDLTATDEGGNTVSSATWSLTDSNEPALFAIATDAGAITLIASDRLDHETTPTHSVIVTAAAAGYQSATATLTINVTNALEKLTIANSGNGVIEIAEGAPTGTAVPGINLVATDENDEPVTDLIWRLTDSAGDLFAIASDTGVISVNRALIFEMSTSHSITAQASSQTVVSDALTLEINVLSAEACAALTPAQFFNGTACVDFAVCVEPATLDETENTCTVPKLRIVADTATIAENATTGTEVAGIDLTATDEGGNTVSSATWSLTDSNEPALFAIATDTGAITLIASDRLDHETTPTHSVIVTAEADGYQSATATLTINVTNALEKLTIANSGNGVIEIAEGAPTGTAVPGINLVATDENDEPVTDLIWRLTDSAGDLFAIASDTGVISVNRALIFEMSTSHSITAQASSQTVVSDALTLEINVLSAEACAALTPAQFFNGTACVDFAVCVEPATLDETENTCTVPKLRIVADTATIAENATTGTEVAGIDLTATDEGGNTVSSATWSLTDSNEPALFAIATDTGAITLIASDRLDHETTPTHSVTVTAAAAGYQSATATLTINVTNVLEELMISDGDTDAATISEAATVGSTLTGVALTVSVEEGGTIPDLAWRLSRNPNEAFAIASTNGAITLAQAGVLDFETAPSIDLEVVAKPLNIRTEVPESDPFTITVTVTNALETLTVADSNTDDNTIAENAATGTAVAGITLIASEGNTAVTGVDWSLASTPTGLFAIDGDGVIRLVAGGSLDFETSPTAAVMVRAEKDGITSPAVELTIAVEDAPEILTINRPDTLAIMDSDPAANTIAENAATGTTVTGITLQARDEAGATVSVAIWSVVSTPTDLFTIDAGGAVRLTASNTLNYEISTSHTIEVRATADGIQSDALSLIILVTDFDETIVPPTVSDTDPALNTIAENSATGTAVSGLRLSVTEMGAAPFGDVIWGLDDPTDTFGIGAVSAEIGLLASGALDYASTRTYSVTVTATLDGAELPSLTLTINVLNDIENVRVQDDDPSPNRVLENAPIDTPISGLSLAAYEMPASGGSVELEQVTWSLADNADFDPYTGGVFAIDAASGELTLAVAADYETSSQHSVWAVAAVTHPITGDVLRGGERFEIRVVNIPETLTIMDGDPAANTIAENAATDTAVTGIALQASEGDLPLTGGIDFIWGLSDAAGGLFAIDPDSGVVTVAGALNFETAPTHTIIAQASTGTVSDTIELTIDVTDVDDVPPPQLVYTATIAEDATTGTAVAGVTLTAQVADGTAAGSAVRWYLLDSNDPDLFAISRATGVITLVASGMLDYETARRHRVMVTAVADGYESVTAPLMIRVTNVLERLTITNSGSGAIEIAENAPTGTVALAATDLTVRDEGNRAVSGVIWSVASAPTGLFAIDPANGEVTVAGAMDYEASTGHTVIVRATKDAVVSNDLSLTIEVLNDPTDDGGTGPSDPVLRLRLRLFLEGPLR